MLIGCGALGTVIADTLVRAGIGRLTIVDRDIVDRTNLQRQVLFTESDAEQSMPKAEAARLRLAAVNAHIEVRACVTDFHPGNASSLLDGVDLLLDGLDNFETRYLLNDLAVKHGLPYLYGGAVGTGGATATILPHPAHRSGDATPRIKWKESSATACLRCLFPEPPPPGTSPTCETAGILAPVAMMVGARQSAEAIKLLAGCHDALDQSFRTFNLWPPADQAFDIVSARVEGDCPCCGQGVFAFLNGDRGSSSVALCGRNAVQVRPAPGDHPLLDLDTMQQKLAAHGSFTQTPFLLTGSFGDERAEDGTSLELTLFPDARAFVRGTTDVKIARAIYAKYIGA